MSRLRMTPMAERVRHDFVIALRSLRRSATFTIATIVILGLGIGMSAAMFTIYKGLLVDRLPIADQDRVLIMHPLDRRRDAHPRRFAYRAISTTMLVA